MMISRRAASRWLYKRIGYEPEAARYFGLLAATYIEDNEPMPIEMQAWLAGGLWQMGGVEAKVSGEEVIEATRVATLGRALRIMRRQGAPRFVDRLFIRMALPAVKARKQSETALAKQVKKRFGVSLNTARNHIRREMERPTPCAEAREWFDSVMAANDLETLVEPRGGACVRP